MTNSDTALQNSNASPNSGARSQDEGVRSGIQRVLAESNPYDVHFGFSSFLYKINNNCRYKTCKAPVKSSPPTNQHPAIYRPDAHALPFANQSTEGEKSDLYRACQKSIPLQNFANFSRTIERYDRHKNF